MASLPEDDRRAADYAAGRLDPQAEAAFERELGSTPALAALVAACGESPAPLAPRVRQQLLDLAHAPALPLDVDTIAWQDLAPGIKYHVVHEDAGRGVRGCLVWAQPGAKTVTHRHLGDEVILVLDGELHDERGVYRSGEICHSREGSVHSEEIPDDAGPCLAYVVYYGELEPLE